MELFKLTCATCATKLKVSQMSAIGQILACPRCGSMVQVEPPAGWTPPPEVAAAAETALAKNPPPRKRVAPDPRLPQTASVTDFEDIDALLSPQGAPAGKVPGQSRRGVERPKAAPSSQPAPAVAPPPPGRTAVSHAVRQRQKALILLMSIAGLLVLAACLVAYLANAFFNPPRAPATSGKSAQTSRSDEQAKENSQANGAAVEPKEPATDLNSPLAVAKALPPPPPLRLPEMIAAASPAETTPGMDPLRPPAQVPTTDSLVSAFTGFDEILRGSESQESLQSVEDAVAAERGRIGIGGVFVRPPGDAPIDIEKNLGMSILGFEFSQQPLIDVLRNLSQASGIPLTLEIDLLASRGISITQPIEGAYENTTCHGVLDQVLPPLGLGYRILDNSVLITVANDQAAVTKTFDMSVFRAADPQLPVHFADYVARTFEPESWQAKGGTGTAIAHESIVTVTHVPRIIAEIERLYQKLEAAQQLLDDPNNTAAQQVLASRYQRAQTARQAAIQLQLLDEQPLDVVLGQIGRDFGPQVLVDWPAILPEGWTPATEIPWKTNGESLYNYLDQLAHSMQLYVRSVDAQILQLTSLQVGNSRPELEVYSCASLLKKISAEALRNRLDRLFESEIEPATVFLEPSCQCLVAFVPQPLQIRLEAALRNME